MKVRDATLKDVLAMTELLSQLFSIEQDFQPDTEKQARGLALIVNKPDQGVIKVVLNDSGVLIGMVSAQLVISTAEGTWSAWIEDMVIHADFRGEGLGRQLLESVLNWAKSKGATRAQLLVDMDNLPALGYYQHLGWQATRLQARRLMLSTQPI